MPDPVRVAHVMGKMVGGGLESVVMNYYRHIDHSRVQFDFIVDEDSTLIPREEIETLGGRVFTVPPYQHVFAYQKALIGLFQEQGWQIVHSHDNALTVFPLRAAKKAGVPGRITHPHSTAGKGEHLRNAIKWVLRKFSRVYPTDFAACGVYAGEWLFGKNTDFTIFPNAIELDRFISDSTVRANARAELRISENTFVVGHAGRFVTQKNHMFLLRVFACIHARIPQSLLLLAGSGPLMEKTKELAQELDIDGSICFLGQRDDVNRLYQTFDAFILPSLYEGFPVVAVECQASGTPILASDTISPEVAITSLMEFESLSSGCQEWARHLLSMKGRGLSADDFKALHVYNIDKAARKLTDYYLSLLGDVSAKDGIH